MKERTIAEGAISAEQARDDHRAWLDGRQLTTRCAARGCRWVHRGTAADGRQAARAHREEQHPDMARAGRRHLTSAQQREAALLKSAWRRKKFQGLD